VNNKDKLMDEKTKKPDLRDKMWEPKTAIDTKDRTFVEAPLPDDANPHIVEPGPAVHVPGHTSKQ
jgi:hypothetical protein